MSRTYHHSDNHIHIQGVRKDSPDLRRLARALIALAEAQAESDAEAEAQLQSQTRSQAKANRKKTHLSIKLAKDTSSADNSGYAA